MRLHSCVVWRSQVRPYIAILYRVDSEVGLVTGCHENTPACMAPWTSERTSVNWAHAYVYCFETCCIVIVSGMLNITHTCIMPVHTIISVAITWSHMIKLWYHGLCLVLLKVWVNTECVKEQYNKVKDGAIMVLQKKISSYMLTLINIIYSTQL